MHFKQTIGHSCAVSVWSSPNLASAVTLYTLPYCKSKGKDDGASDQRGLEAEVVKQQALLTITTCAKLETRQGKVRE